MNSSIINSKNDHTLSNKRNINKNDTNKNDINNNNINTIVNKVNSKKNALNTFHYYRKIIDKANTHTGNFKSKINKK